MKKSLMTAAILAVLAASAVASSTTQGSFDTQLNQAKAEIGRIADEGLYRQVSFDTELAKARAVIDQMAKDGLAAQAAAAAATK